MLANYDRILCPFLPKCKIVDTLIFINLFLLRLFLHASEH